MLLQYLLIAGATLIGVLVVLYLFGRVQDMQVDDAKALHIAGAIRTGAMTFLKEEYKVIAIVVAVVVPLLMYCLGWLAALLFVCGAILSLLTGFVGMNAATQANVRTTMAAKEKGEIAAFFEAFFGGGVMGFAVASVGLFGILIMFLLFSGHQQFLGLFTNCHDAVREAKKYYNQTNGCKFCSKECHTT